MSICLPSWCWASRVSGKESMEKPAQACCLLRSSFCWLLSFYTLCWAICTFHPCWSSRLKKTFLPFWLIGEGHLHSSTDRAIVLNQKLPLCPHCVGVTSAFFTAAVVTPVFFPEFHEHIFAIFSEPSSILEVRWSVAVECDLTLSDFAVISTERGKQLC